MQLWLGLNRTTVECKFKWIGDFFAYGQSLNRTTVECKS